MQKYSLDEIGEKVNEDILIIINNREWGEDFENRMESIGLTHNNSQKTSSIALKEDHTYYSKSVN